MKLKRHMADLMNHFYECDNPQCRLRFPASEGQPRWNRCPLCRSSIHLVATVPLNNEKNNPPNQKHSQLVEAMLDNVRSAWNVGSIFRTADGTGISKLYLCGITPTPNNSKLAKTALGAEVTLSWEKHNNAVLLSRELKSRGYQLWVLEDLPGSQVLFQVEMDAVNSPVVLVVGNEVSGVDPGVLDLCDKVIAIPMIGEKQSYNVAVAFGIATNFLFYRQIFSQGSRNIFPKT
jgi:23S rRNA (guanosine2251-2'-O)-methyltransferase